MLVNNMSDIVVLAVVGGFAITVITEIVMWGHTSPKRNSYHCNFGLLFIQQFMCGFAVFDWTCYGGDMKVMAYASMGYLWGVWQTRKLYRKMTNEILTLNPDSVGTHGC